MMGVHEDSSKMTKPSRSEDSDLLTAEEREKYAQQVQAFLKSTTPTRPLKPSRSESLDDKTLKGLVPTDSCKAELERFQGLVADGQRLRMDGGTVNDDSYVETTYYDDLNAVDKSLHHETGSGFIAREQGGLAFTIGNDAAKVFQTTNKTNPATNEWQPSPSEDVPAASSKVCRSDIDP